MTNCMSNLHCADRASKALDALEQSPIAGVPLQHAKPGKGRLANFSVSKPTEMIDAPPHACAGAAAGTDGNRVGNHMINLPAWCR